jgi:CheY-like chemotaxis protein
MNAIYDDTILDVRRATGLQKKRIVLADDEDTFRKILAIHLADLGYSVNEAVNGEEAIKLFHQKEAPDLLIVDYDMPIKNGAQVIREVRRANQQIPIIVVTGYLLEAEEMMRNSWVTMIGKPFDIDVLDMAIKSHLEK